MSRKMSDEDILRCFRTGNTIEQIATMYKRKYTENTSKYRDDVEVKMSKAEAITEVERVIYNDYMRNTKGR